MTNLYELLGRRVAVLDFETTGLLPINHRVIEIACVRHDEDGREVFPVGMVRPDPMPETLDPFVTDRSGITMEMIAAGAESEYTFANLKLFLKNCLIIGHNVAFDLAFLNAELARHQYSPWQGDFIDTRTLALFTGVGIRRMNRGGYMYLSTTLTDVCEALSITLAGAHRAMNDVEATEAAFPPLYQKALAQHRPILNAMTHPEWLIKRGQMRPDYVPPRAIVYQTA